MRQHPARARALGPRAEDRRAWIWCTPSTAPSGIDISALLQRMSELSIVIKDLQTQQSSLEDIFVSLVSERAHEPIRRRALRIQPPRRLGHLQVRNGARAAHAGAEPGDAGHHHLACTSWCSARPSARA